MTALLALLLTLVGAVGGVIVLVRDPVRQTVLASLFSLLLALVFFSVQAPDVALSELVIGSAAIPVMLLLAIGRVREQQAQHEQEERE
jgi:energy-converting hydrogenase B subunit D